MLLLVWATDLHSHMAPELILLLPALSNCVSAHISGLGCRNFCGSPLFQQYSLYTSLGHKLASIKIPNRPMQWPQRGNKYPSMICLLVNLGAHRSRSLTVILNCGSHAQRHLPLLLTRENGEYKVKWDWQNWLPNGFNGRSLMDDAGVDCHEAFNRGAWFSAHFQRTLLFFNAPLALIPSIFLQTSEKQL